MKIIDNILFVEFNDSAERVAQYCRGHKFKGIVITKDWPIQNRTNARAMDIINWAGPVTFSNFHPGKIDPRKPKPCLHCGSNLVDPEGLIIQGEYRPLCLNCGAAALSLDSWNDRTHLKALVKDAIEKAVRRAKYLACDDWDALVDATIDNPQAT